MWSQERGQTTVKMERLCKEGCKKRCRRITSDGRRLSLGEVKRDNNWGGAAVQELVSPLYKRSNKEQHNE